MRFSLFPRVVARCSAKSGRRRDCRALHLHRTLRLEPLEDRRLLSVSVGDLVWNDLDANGIQDPGEPGLAGAVVEVFSSTDEIVGNADDVTCGVAITDADGNYSLGDLMDGIAYYLVFRPPVGFGLTLQDQGSDDTLDSDADAAGRTGLFTLVPDASVSSRDAGLVGAAPSFGFALGAGGRYEDSAQSLTCDSVGNVYVTGAFHRTADFDPGPGTYDLTIAAYSGVFVAKYTPVGALVWARRLGGTYGRGVVVAADGSVYTTGTFQSAADFDPGPGVFTLTSAGGEEVFISKLDASGNFVWARGLGGTGTDRAWGIATAADGSVYTVGCFRDTADFDPGSDAYLLTSAGSDDVFISKLDASGNFVWARRLGGTSVDDGRAIAVDVDGSVYAAGSFWGTADFDPGSDTYLLTSAGSDDIFISKLDASGKFVWARSVGGTGGDYGEGIALAGDASVYFAGVFSETADFDPGGDVFDLTSAGAYDVFVSKFDVSGTFVWARRLGGASSDFVLGVAVGSDGSVYSAGYFQVTADFDPGPEVFNLTSAGIRDAFVSKLDVSGGFVWARRLGGTGNDVGHGISVTDDGAVYTAGTFQGTVDFDPGPDAYPLTDTGNSDIFVSKLSPNRPPVADAGAPYTIDPGEDLTLDGRGSWDPDLGSGDRIVRYEWDLDADGLFDDAVSAEPVVVLPWSDLAGLPQPGMPNLIALRVIDTWNDTGTASGSLTVSGVSLGVVSFQELNDLGPSGHDLWYRFQTAREAMLTVEASFPGTPDTVSLALYDAACSGAPLATSVLVGSTQRIDWPSAAATTYYLCVSGTSADFDLRLLNLVGQSATEVTVTGTEDSDTFTLEQGTDYAVTVNGVAYHFDRAGVTSIAFDGLSGDDSAVVAGTPGADTFVSLPGAATLSGYNYSITVEQVPNIYVYARNGGDDVAYLNGGDGKDKLKSEDDVSWMYGANYYVRAKFFDKVYADGKGGTDDTAIFYDTPGQDLLVSDSTLTRLTTGSLVRRASSFEHVTVYGSSADTASLFDSPGNDIFDGLSNKSRIYNSGYEIITRGFKTVTATATLGFDKARLYDTAFDDLYECRPGISNLTGGGSGHLAITAQGFDKVSLISTQGGFDTADLYDTPDNDILEAVGWSAKLYRNVGLPELLYEALSVERVRAHGSTGVNARKVAPLVNFALLFDGPWVP